MIDQHKTTCKEHILSKGIMSQLGILDEEMHELGKLISKYRREKVELNELAEETADVFIAWLQLYSLIEDETNSWIDKKIAEKIRGDDYK